MLPVMTKRFAALLCGALLLLSCAPSRDPAPAVADTTAYLQRAEATKSTIEAGTGVAASLMGGSRCTARDGLPDPTCTPGVADPRVTQANIHETICRSGYSANVRPPTSVTVPIKAERMSAYGYTDAPANYELDHLISLELGGQIGRAHV